MTMMNIRIVAFLMLLLFGEIERQRGGFFIAEAFLLQQGQIGRPHTSMETQICSTRRQGLSCSFLYPSSSSSMFFQSTRRSFNTRKSNHRSSFLSQQKATSTSDEQTNDDNTTSSTTPPVTSTTTTSRDDHHRRKTSEEEASTMGPVLDDISSEFQTVFRLIVETTIPRERPTKLKDGHDPFRYEWGTWINEPLLEELMTHVNCIKVKDSSVYRRLLHNPKYNINNNNVDHSDNDNEPNEEEEEGNVRVRIAGGESWDCLLHVLPPETEWKGRWPTGSWAIVKPLLGMSQVSILRGPDRRTGEYKKATTKQLRGGSDGSLGSGTSTTGDKCVKYVGGPLRCYTGLSGNTMLLEIIIRPPINTDVDMTGISAKEDIPNLQERIDSILDFASELLPSPSEEEEVVTTSSSVTDSTTSKINEQKVVPSSDNDNSSYHSNKNNNNHSSQTAATTTTTATTTPIVTTAKEIKRRSSSSEHDAVPSTAATNNNESRKENDRPSSKQQPSLNTALFGGDDDDADDSSKKSFDKVGGLDVQLESIARRVLASRANPQAAKRLGVNHVRGILLSGPPGCGKTLLARELSNLLGAREPQIVNGPEILDKFIGEAEKKVRELFEPAELEYKQVGDDSALHVIILDEMDAIARKRGSASSDTTGVRDSVVNQLLAKMDGVREANNILVVGLTNRPELLDPALLRPGRLEVHLRVELPNAEGRRDILRIHTRQMRQAGGISPNVIQWMENLDEGGLPEMLEHYTGAEIAGLVRSAASFALARAVVASVSTSSSSQEEDGMVTMDDMKRALLEVRPALGKQDDILKQRFPYGISPCNSSMKRITRDLERFVSPSKSFKNGNQSTSSPPPPRLQSMLLVGAGGNGAGAGATALGAWAAAEASANGTADYVRFITALDLLTGGGKGSGAGGDQARAAALVEQFQEAREMTNSLLVLDDIDQLCAGDGKHGYSNVMLATLRALLRTPPPTSSSTASSSTNDMEQRSTKSKRKSMHILATTSRSDAACVTLHELFDETIVVPLLTDAESIAILLRESLNMHMDTANDMAMVIMERLVTAGGGGGEPPQGVGCKTVLRLAERAISSGNLIDFGEENEDVSNYAHIVALAEILDDMASDTYATNHLCEVVV